MAAIQRLAKQAFVTFKMLEAPTFAANLEKLKSLMDSIKASDVNLQIPQETAEEFLHPNEAPVSHITIYECPFFSLGIFIIKRGCQIPLHDHPGMFGLCKVLYGAVNVKSYHRLSEGSNDNNQRQYPFRRGMGKKVPLPFQLENDHSYGVGDGPCVLTPKLANYHAIYALNGSTAFVDILAPPYAPDEDRDCTYYKECDPPISYMASEYAGRSSHNSDRLRWLIPIAPPQDFFCDGQEYTGPEVIM